MVEEIYVKFHKQMEEDGDADVVVLGNNFVDLNEKKKDEKKNKEKKCC